MKALFRPHPGMQESLDRRSIRDASGCVLWCGARTSFGYGNIGVGGKNYGTHRLAWQLRYGAIPQGLFVCHKCDVPHCINPDHLFLGTAAENTADMFRKGRGLRGDHRGERNSRAKLNAGAVLAISRDARPRDEIAREYGVTAHHVGQIQRGKAWRHLSPRGAAP